MTEFVNEHHHVLDQHLEEWQELGQGCQAKSDGCGPTAGGVDLSGGGSIQAFFRFRFGPGDRGRFRVGGSEPCEDDPAALAFGTGKHLIVVALRTAHLALLKVGRAGRRLDPAPRFLEPRL
ncbi:MAG: hypothetical protein GY937_00510 [bacterium]|nr:hypothetical protein [bacterium]